MVSSDTYTILNNVCPGLPFKPAACWFSKKFTGYIGYILPNSRSLSTGKHKNQLRVHISTISCIMSTFMYYICSFFNFPKNFFKYFIHTRYLFFKWPFTWKKVIRSLTIKEHTPSCIWVLMSGWLRIVCLPYRLNSTLYSQKTWPERA